MTTERTGAGPATDESNLPYPHPTSPASPPLDRVRGGCKNPPTPRRREGLQSSLRGECLPVSHANYLFTSESVSEGHPDKVCDQISDAILDAFIENDIRLGIADDSLVNTRLGCETLCTTNTIINTA